MMGLTVFEFCEGVVLPDVQGRPRVPPTHLEQKRLVVSGCLDLSATRADIEQVRKSHDPS